MKTSFTFKTFSNGLTNDPTKWKTHGWYSAGLDIIGIPAISNTSTGARPNTIQLSQDLEANTVSSSQITGLVEWINYFPATSKYYAFEPNSNVSASGRLYRYDSLTWVSAKATSSSSGGGGLQYFNDSLFYSQNAVLGRVSADGSFNNNYQSFTNTTANPRPMKVFSGKLHIGNDNLIATLDSAGSFTAAALTLPAKYFVRSLEVLGDYLVISADNTVTSRIFFWNGTSSTFQEFYDLAESTAPVLVSKDGLLFGIGNNFYQLTETAATPIFPGTFFQSDTGAVGVPTLGEAGIWNNQLLFSMGETGTSAIGKNNIGGLWMFGRYSPEYPYTLHLHFLVPPYTSDQVDVGGIYASNSNLFVGYNDVAGSSYGIASILNNGEKLNSTAHAYWSTLPMDFDTSNKKIFHSIRLNLIGTQSAATPTIAVYYRLDADITAATAPTWNLLGTVGGSSNSSQHQTLPIRQTGRNIQFKFLFNAASSGGNDLTDQLLDYSVVYEPLDSYR